MLWLALWPATGLVFWLGALVATRRFAARVRLVAPPIRWRECAGYTIAGPVGPLLVLIAAVLTSADEMRP